MQMTNHPNRSARPIRSTPRNAFPGDTVRIMQGARRDMACNLWPHETEFEPRTYGADNVRGQVVQVVSIGGRDVEFLCGEI
jgi:hypothetical protein